MGDELIAAGQAERWWQAQHERSCIVDLRGRPRWHDLWVGNPVIVHPTEQATVSRAHHRIVNASNARPYIVYPFTPQTGWTFNRTFRCRDHIGRVYLTAYERALGTGTRRLVGRPYILIEPYSKRPNVRWPLDAWTALVAAAPDLAFVQPVWGDVPRVPGAVHIPATFREACGLLSAARLFVSGDGGLQHAAAALDVPALALWGGCLDWTVLGGYPRQVGVGIAHPPCGRWLPCAHCTASMAAITVDTVLQKIRGVLGAVRVESCAGGA